MIKAVYVVEEVLHCHGLVPQVLHVYLALHLIHEEDTRRQHAHLANAVHVLDFLQDAALGQLLVEYRQPVVLDEALLADAGLAKQLSDVHSGLGSLLDQLLLLGLLQVNHFNYKFNY